VNAVVAGVIDRLGQAHWVNAATSDISELGLVNARKMLVTLERMADYMLHAIGWARGYTQGYTAYLSIALTPPALYRDLMIWAITAVTSRRVVVHVHTADLSGLRPRGVSAPLQRWLNGRSEFWVLGPVLVAPLRGFGAVNVHVVENGVTCDSRYHAEGRSAAQTSMAVPSDPSFGCDGEDVRVVFLSHHFASKGVDLVAELAGVLEGESFAWAFAGSAVEPDTETMLRQLEHLSGRYERIEYVDADVRCRLLHRSDVLVLPSRYPHEASPLVLLEAMEHGVVPIVSSRGCMPGMVGQVGAVCDTLEEYAEALRLLEKDRGELGRRSADASARWRDNYSRASFEHRVTALLADTRNP
jgi:glycosyltransferase involved in cell wall biosynthesis